MPGHIFITTVGGLQNVLIYGILISGFMAKNIEKKWRIISGKEYKTGAVVSLGWISNDNKP